MRPERLHRSAVAGLALLAELSAAGLHIQGAPAGLAELSAAYRLDAALGFGPAV